VAVTRPKAVACLVLPTPSVVLCCSGDKDGHVGGDTDGRNRGCVVCCARGVAAGVIQQSYS